jgi:hypothetical protein
MTSLCQDTSTSHLSDEGHFKCFRDKMSAKGWGSQTEQQCKRCS